MPHHEESPAADAPSKSERKRRMQSLQKTGEALIELTDAELEAMPLPAPLLDAVQTARKLRNKHAAFKRQRQFIGKLMRDIDAEPIAQALESLAATRAGQTADFHAVERWRERLLSDEYGRALTELMATHHVPDTQHLRQLVRKARDEQQDVGPNPGKRHRRALFAALREILAD